MIIQIFIPQVKIHKDNYRDIDKYQRGYLRHLLNTKELTVLYLITYHNLYFMQNLMCRIQAAVNKGTFSEFQKEFGKKWSSGL